MAIGIGMGDRGRDLAGAADGYLARGFATGIIGNNICIGTGRQIFEQSGAVGVSV
ncbi:hypothetical protein SDC9_46597 [bioreactor metagenome]|uniref:Uncharacterized protein n=1 Tax=bioreactor metagenome TaxID=1076179 RepID=A0A644WCT0_9ZZZZ